MKIAYSDPYTNAEAMLIDRNRYGTGPDRKYPQQPPVIKNPHKYGTIPNIEFSLGEREAELRAVLAEIGITLPDTLDIDTISTIYRIGSACAMYRDCHAWLELEKYKAEKAAKGYT